MKKLLTSTFLLLVIFRAAAQETTTYSVDSIAPRLWVFVSTTRYDRPDSTFYEARQSQKFRSRAQLRQHVREFFAQRITADSIQVEDVKRKIANSKAFRQGLLTDLNRNQSAPRSTVTPTPPQAVTPTPETPKKKPKKQ